VAVLKISCDRGNLTKNTEKRETAKKATRQIKREGERERGIERGKTVVLLGVSHQAFLTTLYLLWSHGQIAFGWMNHSEPWVAAYWRIYG